MNLQDYRKRKFRFVKDFAYAYGCSPSKAGMILNGRYHLTLTKDEVVKIAALLGISFETCIDACDESYAQLKGYRGDAWKNRKRRYKGRFHEALRARWDYEGELWHDAQEGTKTGDWSKFQEKTRFDWKEETGYSYHDSSSGKSYYSFDGNGTSQQNIPACFIILGIPLTHDANKIKEAFRAKVKLSADGKGGYQGDMDKLVNAKEQALKYAEGVK